MRIGICDDEPVVFEELKRYLETYMEGKRLGFQLFTFTSEEMLKKFLQQDILDLLFMDIDMPGKNGITLAEEILKLQPDCQIAYCTNYLEYATDVYETKHCYYVLKREFEKRLPHVIARVLEAESDRQDSICIAVHGGKEVIRKDDIVYIERRGKKSYLFLENGMVKETGLKLDELLKLLHSNAFARCHNSYIVSFRKVKKYSRQQIVLEEGKEITVSRTYIEPVKEAFAEWNWNRI